MKEKIDTSKLQLLLYLLLIFLQVSNKTQAQEIFSNDIMSIYSSPDSEFNLEIDSLDNRIFISNKISKNIKFEIDCDDTTDDKSWDGIIPIINGNRLEGNFFRKNAPFITPDIDFGKSNSVSVFAELNKLRITYEGGNLQEGDSTMLDCEPVKLNAAISFDSLGNTNIRLSGLYYVLPSKFNTKVNIKSGNELFERTITENSSKSLEYFEDVTGIEVKDEKFGNYSILTYVEKIQFQVHEDKTFDLFELDFDHSFKDKGQRSVYSKIIFYTGN
jgi:hypothetical protein